MRCRVSYSESGPDCGWLLLGGRAGHRGGWSAHEPWGERGQPVLVPVSPGQTAWVCPPSVLSWSLSESPGQSRERLQWEARGVMTAVGWAVRRHRGHGWYVVSSRHILICLSPLTILPSGDTPASPQSDYSLFLSENGHLSFENPNYQASVDQ